MADQGALQFGRVCTLVIANRAGKGLDLSKFRIVFNVKRNGVMSPNSATIRVYNIDVSTANDIGREFTQVILQAGYVGNYGVIFKGNILQFIIGRESATDTFIDIIAGDGDQAYAFAKVNLTMAAGSSQTDHLNASLNSMQSQGVGQAFIGNLPANKLPRGKVMYGKAVDHIQRIAQSAGFGWSIQDQNVNLVNLGGYLPGTVVVLSSKTGMIGTPRQTIAGIEFQCLLNPKLKIHGRVQVDNASVAQFQINPLVPGSASNNPVPLTYDGIYYIYVLEYQGDTRGTPWYCNLVTLSTKQATNPLESVGSH